MGVCTCGVPLAGGDEMPLDNGDRVESPVGLGELGLIVVTLAVLAGRLRLAVGSGLGGPIDSRSSDFRFSARGPPGLVVGTDGNEGRSGRLLTSGNDSIGSSSSSRMVSERGRGLSFGSPSMLSGSRAKAEFGSGNSSNCFPNSLNEGNAFEKSSKSSAEAALGRRGTSGSGARIVCSDVGGEGGIEGSGGRCRGGIGLVTSDWF